MNIEDRHILIVEDDNVFRSRLSRALKERGLFTSEADSVSTAIELCRSECFDFAVIDLKLPGGTGLDVLRSLVQRSPDCKSIILTGYGTIATTVDAIKMGAAHYLTKPTNIDVLLATLTGAVDKERAVKDTMPLPTLQQVEWNHIQTALRDCDGNITQAAKQLGMHRRSLQRKLAKDPGPMK